MKRYKESVLDPIHKNLNPNIWDSKQHILPDVRNEILKILYEWLESHNLTDTIVDINFLGSNTGYQYSDTADIDINVQLEIDDDTVFDLIKQLPNGNLLSGTQHPINYYIITEPKEFTEHQGSVYNLIDNRWIIRPKKENNNIPFTYIIESAKVFMKGIDDRITEYERDKVEKELYESYVNLVEGDEKNSFLKIIDYKTNEMLGALEGLKVIWDLLHKLRYEGYEYENPRTTLLLTGKKGNLSYQNQIYKIIEKFGYHEKLQHYAKIRKENIIKNN